MQIGHGCFFSDVWTWCRFETSLHPLDAHESMLFAMFGMVGIPPFIGFYAKWIVLSELITADMLGIALIAIIMSVIAAFYYIRVVWYMYFEKNDLPVMQGTSNILQKTSFSIVGLSILVIGFYPSPIIDFCKLIISPFLLIDR